MYISPERLIAAFSHQTILQLSQDDPLVREINQGVITQAIESAQERIDAALRGRYQLPLSAVPTLISHHALSLARYWLYARRVEVKMPDVVKETYNQALKELDQIALGKLHLGLDLATLVDKSGGQNATSFSDLMPDQGEYLVKSPARLDTRGY